jgi:DNA-binding transcriptional LysR family regulator
MLVRLVASCPDAEVELTEAFRDVDLLSSLAIAEIDLCVAELPLPEGPFGCAVVAQEPFVLVVQVQSPLAERSTSPSLREIAALPLLCSRHSRGGERALQALRDAAAIRVVCCSDTASMLHGLVAAGLGVALLPRSAADRRDPHTAVIDLAELLPPFDVGVVWNTSVERSAAVEAVLGAAELGPRPTDSSAQSAPTRTTDASGSL